MGQSIVTVLSHVFCNFHSCSSSMQRNMRENRDFFFTTASTNVSFYSSLHPSLFKWHCQEIGCTIMTRASLITPWQGMALMWCTLELRMTSPVAWRPQDNVFSVVSDPFLPACWSTHKVTSSTLHPLAEGKDRASAARTPPEGILYWPPLAQALPWNKSGFYFFLMKIIINAVNSSGLLKPLISIIFCKYFCKIMCQEFTIL